MKRNNIFYKIRNCQRHLSIAISFLLIFLMGCTLSMEDWKEPEIPEEKRGVDSAYSYKDEFIDITYKYNKGVKPITENVLKYFMGAEHDTILYFSDNVPEEWMPQAGGCVQIGVSDIFPIGYAGKVLERTDANGTIRLVTTPATINDIFEELEYKAEIEPDMTIPEGYDINTHDTNEVTVDYSLVADQFPKLYAKQKGTKWAARAKRTAERRRRARMGMSRKDMDTPETKTEDDVLSIKLDINGDIANIHSAVKAGYENRDGGDHPAPTALKKYMSKIGGRIIDLAKATGANAILNLTFTQTTHTTFTTYYSKSKEISEQTEEDVTTTEVDINAGLQFGGTAVSKKVKEAAEQKIAKELMKKALAENKTAEEALESFLLYRDKKLISIYPPAALFLKLEPEVGFELNVTGCCNIHYERTSTTVSGSRQVGDDDPVPIKKSTNGKGDWTIGFTGSIAAGVYAQFAAGLSIADMLDIKVIPKLSFGFEANRSPNLWVETKTWEGTFEDEYFSTKTYVGPYLNLSIAVKVQINVLGKEVYGEQLTIFDHNFLEDYRTYWYPSFSKNLKLLDASITSGFMGAPPVITAKYKFTENGLLCTLLPSSGKKRFSPRLIISPWAGSGKWTYQDYPFDRILTTVLNPRDASTGTSYASAPYEKNTEYTFQGCPENGYSEYTKSWVVVPALYDYENERYIIYNSYARLLEDGEAYAEMHDVVQTKGRTLQLSEASEFKKSKNPFNVLAEEYYSNWNLIEFEVCLQLGNSTKIKTISIDGELTCHNKEKDIYVDYQKSFSRPFTIPFGNGYATFKIRLAVLKDQCNQGIDLHLTPCLIDNNGKKTVIGEVNEPIKLEMADRSSGLPGTKY